jgi:CRP/FNR family transcriptional regulator
MNELSRRFASTFPELGKNNDLINEIGRHGRGVALPPGQHICLEGTSCDQLAFILSGTARIYKTGETGREITLYRLDRGECCILTLSCILSDRRFPAFAISETEMEAAMVPAAVIQRWMEQLPVWRHHAWDLVASRLGDIISLVEEITFRRMDQRLELYLRRADRFPPGEQVQITHQQIATELGTSREVVSRLLKDLEQRQLVQLGRGWLRLLRPPPA